MSNRGACVLMILLAGSFPAFAQDACPPDGEAKANMALPAAQFVRLAINHDLQAQADDHSHWRYQETSTEGGKVEVREVYRTQTGDIDRLLALNGEPLPANQERAERARVRKLPDDAGEVQKSVSRRREDWDREQKMLISFTDAFLYCYVGVEGDLITLKFSPNPDFHPVLRQGQVIHHLQGTMWIDRHQMRLAGMDGTLTSEVEFGGGLLGHVDEGGTFSVRVQDLGGGHWRPTRIDVHMSGRALIFKTITVQEEEVFSNYTLIPDDMTLHQAAAQLGALQPSSTATATQARKSD